VGIVHHMMVVAPRSETEHGVTALWADVVGRRPSSIDDHFLEAGGELHEATRLLARVNDRWQVDVTLEEFLAASSIAGLAATIERKVADQRTRDSGLLNDVLKDLEAWSG
jgi:hypothetical protein